MTQERKERKILLPDWVADLVLTFSDYDESIIKAEDDLGTINSLGRIRTEYTQKARDLLSVVRQELGDAMPDYVLLQKGHNKRMYVETNLGVHVIGSQPSVYYLPKTHEFYGLRHDLGEIPPQFYPDSPDFIGVDSAREDSPFGVVVSKVGRSPHEDLTEDHILRILDVSVEWAIEKGDKEAIIIAKEQLGGLLEEQETVFKATEKQHAWNAKRRLNNISRAIIYHLGEDVLPGKIRNPTKWIDEVDGPGERYYLPHEGRMVTVPVKRKKVLGASFELHDFRSAVDSEERDWLLTRALASELFYTLPEEIRDMLKEE